MKVLNLKNRLLVGLLLVLPISEPLAAEQRIAHSALATAFDAEHTVAPPAITFASEAGAALWAAVRNLYEWKALHETVTSHNRRRTDVLCRTDSHLGCFSCSDDVVGGSLLTGS
jgi:hypothetical protein